MNFTIVTDIIQLFYQLLIFMIKIDYVPYLLSLIIVILSAVCFFNYFKKGEY